MSIQTTCLWTEDRLMTHKCSSFRTGLENPLPGAHTVHGRTTGVAVNTEGHAGAREHCSTLAGGPTPLQAVWCVIS